MLKARRHPSNPLLSPNHNANWESFATFNGCPSKDATSGIINFLYRAMTEEKEHNGHLLHVSSIGHAISADGINFSQREEFIKPEQEWEKFGCEDPRVTKLDDEYFIFYTALSDYPFHAQGIRVAVAITDDFTTIKEKHLVTPFNAKAMALFPKKIKNKYTAILTAHTDLPPSQIAIAQCDSREELWSEEFWERWHADLDEHTLPLQRMNNDQVELGAAPIETPYGWFVIYSYIKNYTTSYKSFGIEAVLLDLENPRKIIGRLEENLLVPQEIYELEGIVSNIVFPSGALLQGDSLQLYYGAADTSCCLATFSMEELYSKMHINAVHYPKCDKSLDNPILIPNKNNPWESKAVFNPTAVQEKDTFHLVYRAMSDDNTSVMGYAKSTDGMTFEESSTSPIYIPQKSFEEKKTPNGNSGCEDPRITKLENRFFMFYTAYDGVNPPRVAMTSIAVNDFIENKWLWNPPVLISPPDIDDKDACIFPEKINGKYVIIHRITPDICFDFVDTLDFDGKTKWLQTKATIQPRDHAWDSLKIGVSSPPIKTEAGWLLLYHGIGKKDHEYRVGAMLLKEDDPSQVLARTKHPILEPELPFERQGEVPNVVFPCGTVSKDGKLYVYYGAADKVICVATIEMNDLMGYLKESTAEKFLK